MTRLIAKRKPAMASFLGALLVLFGATWAAAPATQPVSVVQGMIRADGDVPLSEMLIYLESPDPNRPIAAATRPAVISQKGAQFEPRMLVVSIGQSVDFMNDEDRPIEHNVFSNSPTKRFDLGLYRPGQAKAVVFDKPGPVFLFCSIHRYMDGVVFVSPTPYTSRVAGDGHYQIENVPPGDWVVKTWQRRKRFMEQSVPVTAQADKPITLDLELKHK